MILADCIWREKKVCKLKAPECAANCDLKGLAFEQQAILDRIAFERRKIARLYFFSKDRKKSEIADRTKGVYVLYSVLQKHFGLDNPLKKEAETFMTDNDRMMTLLSWKKIKVGKVRAE